MKQRGIKKLGLIFLLLLVFFQQIGAGLYVNNLLHNNKARHSKHNEAAKEISFTCSCVDNFLTPCIETDEPVIEPPVSVHAKVTSFFVEKKYFTSVIFSSLRGPPVFIG